MEASCSSALPEGLLPSKSASLYSRRLTSVSLSRSCVGAVELSFCRVSELFWQHARRRGALALTVVAVAVPLSLAHPAMSEADLYFGQLMEDAPATVAPSGILRLGFELEQSPVLAANNGALAGGDSGRDNSLCAIAGSSQGEQRRTSAMLVVPMAVGRPSSAVASVSTPQQIVLMPGAPQVLTWLLQHLGRGGLAGAVGAMVVYPLDTIKTRLQAQSKDEKYKDVQDCLRKLLLEEGLGSLYNGLVPQLLGIAPEKALKLTVNEVMLGVLEQHLPGARVWALEFIAGGGGGFSQVLVTNPMEIVKLRLQIQSKSVSPKGLWEMVQELGLRGLYNGSCITLARDVPSSAIFFACYALLTQMYPDQRFWAGFLAAIPATIFATPLDVIKTRLQMETPPGEEPYKDACHCVRVLLKQEGLRGLFKGGLLRVLRTSPQFGITLVMYSFLCDRC